jgi:hypothetical protein
MSARPLTTMDLIVSPGTQTALGSRDASSRPTVVLPAAGTPEITKSAMLQPYAVPRLARHGVRAVRYFGSGTWVDQ